MKKCPNCLREIQNDAVFCQYCGLEIQIDDFASEKTNQVKKYKRTPMQIGLLLSAIMGACNIISIFINYSSGPEIIGHLLFSVPAIFGIFAVIFAFIVWAWRKLFDK